MTVRVRIPGEAPTGCEGNWHTWLTQNQPLGGSTPPIRTNPALAQPAEAGHLKCLQVWVQIPGVGPIRTAGDVAPVGKERGVVSSEGAGSIPVIPARNVVPERLPFESAE